jgi:predicted nucleic acid-binding protein
VTAAFRPSLFIDASAWVALVYPRESRHREARMFLETLASAARAFGHNHTSVHTLSQAYGWLLHHAGRGHAMDLLRRAERGIHLHTTDADLLWDATTLLRPKGAAAVELADAMNVVLMSRHKIQSIWTYDDDYKKLGYDCVG